MNVVGGDFKVVRKRPRVRVRRPAAGRAFTQAEDRALVKLWRSNLDIRSINVELWRMAFEWHRPIDEVCRRIDELIGPAAVNAGQMTNTERALFVLAGRAEENLRADGGFTLDGRKAAFCNIMTAANRVLFNLGQPVIAWPGDGGDK